MSENPADYDRPFLFLSHPINNFAAPILQVLLFNGSNRCYKGAHHQVL